MLKRAFDLNPIACVRAVALLRHSPGRAELAVRMEDAVTSVLVGGLRTVDMA